MSWHDSDGRRDGNDFLCGNAYHGGLIARSSLQPQSLMAMKRYVAFVLIAVAMLFAGCANQRDSDPQAKADKAAQQKAAKEIGSMDDLKCQSFGYQPGSVGYSRCRKEFDVDRDR